MGNRCFCQLFEVHIDPVQPCLLSRENQLVDNIGTHGVTCQCRLRTEILIEIVDQSPDLKPRRMCLIDIISAGKAGKRSRIVQHGKPGRRDHIHALHIGGHRAKRRVCLLGRGLMPCQVDLVISPDPGKDQTGVLYMNRSLLSFGHIFLFYISCIPVLCHYMNPVLKTFQIIQWVSSRYTCKNIAFNPSPVSHNARIGGYFHLRQTVPFGPHHSPVRFSIKGIVHICILLYIFHRNVYSAVCACLHCRLSLCRTVCSISRRDSHHPGRNCQ